MTRTLRDFASLAAFMLFAFLLHFVWEFLQVPFFAQMPTTKHWQAIGMCLRATIGDVAIALVSFAMAALVDRSFRWFLQPSGRALSAYLATGLIATIFLERHAIATARWSYSDLMPVLPAIGIRLIPIVQWTVLPLVTLLLTRRLHMGSTGRRHPGGQ
jgi:hypothetical protein